MRESETRSRQQRAGVDARSGSVGTLSSCASASAAGGRAGAVQSQDGEDGGPDRRPARTAQRESEAAEVRLSTHLVARAVAAVRQFGSADVLDGHVYLCRGFFVLGRNVVGPIPT